MQASMSEVQALHLPRCPLVVLSECDSFKGEMRLDGVVGISRAFVAAGAPTLLASLWKVDDEATRALMSRFYEHHLAGKDAADALQAAMIASLQEGRANAGATRDLDDLSAGSSEANSVLRWAPFVCYGLAMPSSVSQAEDLSEDEEMRAAIALSLSMQPAAPAKAPVSSGTQPSLQSSDGAAASKLNAL